MVVTSWVVLVIKKKVLSGVVLMQGKAVLETCTVFHPYFFMQGQQLVIKMHLYTKADDKGKLHAT